MTSSTSFLSEIESIGDNEDNLRQLIEQMKTPIGVIPFVGAGLSIPFGFPGWSNFLMEQAKKAGIDVAIKERLDQGEYMEAAEDLLSARGYLAFHDAISNTFGNHKFKDKELGGAVSYLPKLVTGPVITTNFDHVLEEMFKKAGAQFEREVWGAKAEMATRAFVQNKKFLLKIHGDAEDNTDRILTKSDYSNHYGSSDGSKIDYSLPLPSLLKQMLSGRPLLFLGCSLHYDHTVRVLEEVSRTLRSIAHYAIVEQPSSVEQFYKRSLFLSNHNIRPIWYPSGRHDFIEAILEYVVEKTTNSQLHPPLRPWLPNKEISEFIDLQTSKMVLILGRFAVPERKHILDTLRGELEKRDYTPVMFDFEEPTSRGLAETLSILAHLSHFIIADLTHPKSIPLELQLIVPNLPSVPVVPLLLSGENAFSLFQHIKMFNWVLPIVQYEYVEDLVACISERIITPAEDKVKEMRSRINESAI
jgi:hypothetical protein